MVHTIPTRTMLALAFLLLGCVPMATEPRPDIPEIPDESTILLELGDSEFDTDALALSLGSAVGEPSELARLTRVITTSTNAELKAHLQVIREIRNRSEVTDEDGVWTWNLTRDGLRYDFSIRQTEETDTYRYVLLAGMPDEGMPMRNIFAGTMTVFARIDGTQQAFGVFDFVFDEAHRRPARGRMQVGFRRRNGVRQVNVGITEFSLSAEPSVSRNALYEYEIYPNRRGRFRYFAKTDKFGSPTPPIGVDTVFLANGGGRGATALPPREQTDDLGGVVVDECWDAAGTTLFVGSQPLVPIYDDGNRSDCNPELLEIPLSPPTEELRDPSMVVVQIPRAHPLEDPE